MTENLFLALALLVFSGFALGLVYAHAQTVDRKARVLGAPDRH